MNLILHIRGKKAPGLVLILMALVVVRFTREHELPPMAHETILLRLKADYAREVTEQNHATSERMALEAQAAGFAARQQVRIDRAKTRGILWPKYVRVEVSVAGALPPDGRAARYFTIDWSGNATAEISGFKYHFYLW